MVQANVENLVCHFKSIVIYRTMQGQAFVQATFATYHNATLSTYRMLLTKENLLGKGDLLKTVEGKLHRQILKSIVSGGLPWWSSG